MLQPIKCIIVLLTFFMCSCITAKRSQPETATLKTNNTQNASGKSNDKGTEEMQQATSVRGGNFMTAKEKEIIQWLNIARMYPKWFAAESGFNKKENSYTKSLHETLMNMQPISSALTPDKALWVMAECHARTGGQKGIMGHDRASSECKMEMGGECIYYGTRPAKAIILRLLIDKDLPKVPHRDIMLDANFKNIGVSIQPHNRKGIKEHAVLTFK